MSSLPDMLNALERIFPDGPSWPFRTESGRRVWKFAERIFEKHPDWEQRDVLRTALDESGVSGFELTEDDQVILAMALRWKALVLRNGKPFSEPARRLPQLRTK